MQLKDGAAVGDTIAYQGSDHAQVINARPHRGEQVTDFNATLAVVPESPGRFHEVSYVAFGKSQGALEGERFAIVARQTGLGVKRIDAGWPSLHEQENNSLGSGSEVRRLGRKRIHRFGFGTQAG